MHISPQSPTSPLAYGLSHHRSIAPAAKQVESSLPRDEYEFQFVPDTTTERPVASARVATQAESKLEESIRPQVRQAIDFIAGSDECRIIHTTRGFTPKYPDGFAAGRFAVTATGGGESKTFIMQTESRVGHLGQVVPGKTRVDGFIAQVADPYAEVNAGTQFTEAELKALTVAMMGEKPHDPVTDVVAAIYSNGDQAKYASALIEGTKLSPVG